MATAIANTRLGEALAELRTRKANLEIAEEREVKLAQYWRTSEAELASLIALRDAHAKDLASIAKEDLGVFGRKGRAVSGVHEQATSILAELSEAIAAHESIARDLQIKGERTAETEKQLVERMQATTGVAIKLSAWIDTLVAHLKKL